MDPYSLVRGVSACSPARANVLSLKDGKSDARETGMDGSLLGNEGSFRMLLFAVHRADGTIQREFRESSKMEFCFV